MSTITKQDVLDELEKLDLNQANDPECVYTNDAGRHCIAGQIMVNLGIKLPPATSPVNQSAISSVEMGEYVHNFDPDAIHLLDDLQRTADHDVCDWETGGIRVEHNFVRFPWGEVITRVKEGRGF